MPRSLYRHVSQLFLVVAGSILMSISYNLFLIPHRIVPGGVGGIAMILNHFFRLPVGAVIFILNVPLFWLGWRTLGRGYFIKSLIGVAVSSAAIDGATYVLHLGPATQEPILACIFGGILLGAGLGLVFRGGGSTGGSDIVGMVLAARSNLSTGTAILAVDALVITASGLAFGNFELALYGFVNLYLQSRSIDLVLEGLSYTRAMFIISDKAAEIAEAITRQMNRGATILNATGAWTRAARHMAFAVMSKREVARAREVAAEIDPDAFVVITDVYEVLGKGFKPRT